MKTYKGHKIERTNYTTDVYRICFGRNCKIIVRCYSIDGQITRLTSLQAVKDYINSGE